MDYETAMDDNTMVSKAHAIRELKLHGLTLEDYENEMGPMNEQVKTKDILHWLGY